MILTDHMRKALIQIGAGGDATGLSGSALEGLERRGLVAGERGTYNTWTITSAGQQLLAEWSAPACPRPAEAPVARIQRLAAQHFQISAIEMTSPRRDREIARARQVAMYLSRQLTPKSLIDIGRRFGGRDHTTVIHAIRTVERLAANDARLADSVSTLTREILSTGNEAKGRFLLGAECGRGT